MSGIIHIVKDDKPKPEHTEIWETRAYVSNLGVVVHEAVCVWAKPDENGITTHRPNKYSSAMPMKDHNGRVFAEAPFVIPARSTLRRLLECPWHRGEKAAQEFVKNLQDWASTTGAA